jgi:hypothetical protein
LRRRKEEEKRRGKKQGRKRNRKNGKRKRNIYFQKLVYINLVQTVHSQTFQTPLQLPENIGSF